MERRYGPPSSKTSCLPPACCRGCWPTATPCPYRKRFLVNGARSLYTLAVDDVCYFYSEEKVTFAVTADRRTHIIDLPLTKLEELLDPRRFFRVSRQFILSADCIRDIEPYFNGKMVVHVTPPFDGSVQVSRERVAALKVWLNS